MTSTNYWNIYTCCPSPHPAGAIFIKQTQQQNWFLATLGIFTLIWQTKQDDSVIQHCIEYYITLYAITATSELWNAIPNYHNDMTSTQESTYLSVALMKTIKHTCEHVGVWNNSLNIDEDCMIHSVVQMTECLNIWGWRSSFGKHNITRLITVTGF